MSRRDAALQFRSARYVMDTISSEDKELLVLERSGHNILVDVDRQQVMDRCADFIAARTA